MVTPRVRELVRNGARIAPDDRSARRAAPPRGAGASADVVRLVEAARDGDHRAWADLVQRFEPLVRRVAAGFRLAPCDADDVVQRTWLKLFESIDSVSDPARLPGWLATTTRRICLDQYQRRLREFPMEEIEVAGAEQGTAELVIAAERRRIVRDAVAELPGRQRMLVTLMTQGPERAYTEIASALGMPVGSIGPTYGRSLQRLREHPRLAQIRGE